MKLMNFRRFDPEGRKGLKKRNKEEAVVWREFAHDPEHLAQVARAIRGAIRAKGSEPCLPDVDDGPDEAPEGRILTRSHRQRERNRALVERRKAKALGEDGRLVCQVCGFDFLATYGERGSGFMECHHTKPVYLLAPGQKTRLEDLAMVCANCHRMIHAAKPWLTLDQLRACLAANGKR